MVHGFGISISTSSDILPPLNLDLLSCPNSCPNWEPSIRTLKTMGCISFKPLYPFNGISRVDVVNPQSDASWGSNLPLLLDFPVEVLTPFWWQQASPPGSVIPPAAGVWHRLEHGHIVLVPGQACHLQQRELLRRMCLANVRPLSGPWCAVSTVGSIACLCVPDTRKS